MGYRVMTVDEEARAFVVQVQKEHNLVSQSQAIYLLQDLYEKKRKKVSPSV